MDKKVNILFFIFYVPLGDNKMFFRKNEKMENFPRKTRKSSFLEIFDFFGVCWGTLVHFLQADFLS